MVVSVHQPQYLPWLGYFDKISRSDVFVLLDNTQYKKREFQNRNKIKTPKGALWLTVPVQTKGTRHQKIREIAISNDANWQRKHWQSIEWNYRKAPFFLQYKDEIQALYGSVYDKLNILNQSCVRLLMRLLNISTPIVLESDLDVRLTRTDRIIDICQKVGGTSYLSGTGGKAYLDENLLLKSGIELKYQDYIHPVYSQLFDEFVPYLSVIDLLFNCGKESLKILRR